MQRDIAKTTYTYIRLHTFILQNSIGMGKHEIIYRFGRECGGNCRSSYAKNVPNEFKEITEDSKWVQSNQNFMLNDFLVIRFKFGAKILRM